MSYHLGPISTEDDYTNTLMFESRMPCVRLTGFVSENSCFYSILDQDSANWSDDKFIPSAKGQTVFVSFERNFSAIKFKSAVVGAPAIIAFDLLTRADIP